MICRFFQSKFEGKKIQKKNTGGLFYLYEIIEIRAETTFPPIKKNKKKVEILIKKDTKKKIPADYSTGGLFYLFRYTLNFFCKLTCLKVLFQKK